MQAVILAAGEGVRMRPLTLERPKALVEISGKSLLEHMMDALPTEVDEIIVVIGYKGDMIRERFGDRFRGRTIRYVKQKEKQGTARAVQLVAPLLRAGERFFVSYADDLHDATSIRRLLDRPLGLLTMELPDPRTCGVVEVDAQGRILDIVEKPENPKTNIASIGVYLLDDRIFHYEPDLHPNGEYFLTTMIEKMVRDHDMYIVPSSFWIQVSSPDDVLAAEKVLGTLGSSGEK